jgi:hypothetical protein
MLVTNIDSSCRLESVIPEQSQVYKESDYPKFSAQRLSERSVLPVSAMQNQISLCHVQLIRIMSLPYNTASYSVSVL